MATYQKKQAVQRVPFSPKFPASEEQGKFFEAAKDGSNLHLDAKAGSGKSTTLLWEMSLSDKGKSAAMMAFNKSIVEDIEPKCATNVTVKTCHSFGLAALTKKVGRTTVDQYKTEKILKDYRWLNPDGYSGPEKMKVVSRLMDACSLVEKLKVTLTNEHDRSAIHEVISRFRIELDMEDEVIEIIPEIFRKIEEIPTVIDFTDMMWLAIRLDLPIQKFDKLYVDEAQDFNALMIAYAQKMAGGQVITVGDARQSIYGFSGADTKSIEKLTAAFGSQIMPLNTCYRCGSKIIEEAQKIVPEIVAHSSTGEGVVNRFDILPSDILEGSMILSRRNANLIKPCFQLLREGKKAIIKGRDIGAGLIRLIDSFNAPDIPGLMIAADDWAAKKIEKIMKMPRSTASAIEAVQDQADCIKAIAEECDNIYEVKIRIQSLFSEDRKGIILSSIHRSKGLEAEHVAILDYSRVRLSHEKMTPDEHMQEANLQYVGITRAKKRLDLIG